jgi:hypothetical protein
MTEEKQTKRVEPKVPVQLDPPKDDPISVEELAKCDGMALPLTKLPRQFQQLRSKAMINVVNATYLELS